MQGRIDTAGNAADAVEADRERRRAGGRRFDARFAAPGQATITEHVAGIYADNQLLGPFLANGDVYRQLTPRDRWSAMVVLVQRRPGCRPRPRCRRSSSTRPNAYYVVSRRDPRRVQGDGRRPGQRPDRAWSTACSALAIVIAILGIINTLALSVVERRREIGMLRAVGMQRKQVRRTIYLESLLIAVFGAVLGLGLGIGFGSLFTRSLPSQGLDPDQRAVGAELAVPGAGRGRRRARRAVARHPGGAHDAAGGHRVGLRTARSGRTGDRPDSPRLARWAGCDLPWTP